MDPQNEVEKFFDDLPSQDKPLNESLEEKKPEEDSEKEEELEEAPKNRTERRLREKYQRERESNIALTERIKVLAEVDRTLDTPSNSEMPSEWIALYGNTPESEKAWKIQEKMMRDMTSKAEDRAVERFRNEQARAVEDKKRYESEISDRLESIEDEYAVDLTSNSPKAQKMRNEFLGVVESLSPKDENGNITGYADFNIAFDLYQKTREEKKDNSRRKEIASPSMQRSGQVNNQSENDDATERWLNQQGIKTRNS